MVQGIAKKRADIFELIKQISIDVVLLQETHSDEKNVALWAMEWNGLSFLSNNNLLSMGVAVHFSKKITPVSYVDMDEILKGRVLKIRAVFENEVFICVYASNATKDRIAFFRYFMFSFAKMY